MIIFYRSRVCFFLACLYFFIGSCNNHRTAEPPETKIISSPEKMDQQASVGIRSTLDYALQHRGKIADSIVLPFTAMVNDFYQTNNYQNIWSHQEQWDPLADTLYQFIEQAAGQGLFPNDYHWSTIRALKNSLDNDSAKRMDANLWTRADLLFTDAFMHLVKDLKIGRLNNDSFFVQKNETADEWYVPSLIKLLATKQLTVLLQSLEPKITGYWDLKNNLPGFVDSMDTRRYTYVPYPYKAGDEKDSLFFIHQLQQRLNESNCIDYTDELPDSTDLQKAVKKYQAKRKLPQDGKLSATLVKMMNTTDVERFKRIAITLDRYKQLPDSMPEKYIWVNLPSYYLQVWDHDSIAFESKTIIGKPATSTPLLNSYITDMITYPTWTVPSSIISKQLLPKLKNNPNYLSKIGLKVVNHKGETLSAADINWSKYSKFIPYKVMQSSGDDNALGVIKFNFSNPYAVYLHDTNQRYLFKNAARALSHGCVRVQEWEQLAAFIARNDSLNISSTDTLRYTTDSIKNWIGNKEHKRISVKNKLSLFIVYFSCQSKNGKIKFYDDIYGLDKAMREKYFAGK